MTILNADSIKRLGIVTPHRAAYRHSNGLSGGQSVASYDVHVDTDLTIWPIHMSYLVEGNRLVLDPTRRISAIAATQEYLRMPLDVGGIFALKSTHARLHASQAVTWTDPGFGLNADDQRGCQLVVELSNLGEDAIHFEAGSPIGQMVFLRSERTSGYVGRYGNQSGAQGPIVSGQIDGPEVFP